IDAEIKPPQTKAGVTLKGSSFDAADGVTVATDRTVGGASEAMATVALTKVSAAATFVTVMPVLGVNRRPGTPLRFTPDTVNGAKVWRRPPLLGLREVIDGSDPDGGGIDGPK